MKTDRRTLVILVAVGVAVLWVSHLSRGTWIRLSVLIPAIILHEVSHGVVALAFGDDTAKRAGRLTLNPIAHVDPVGSVALPLLLAVAGAPIFGWAKPACGNDNVRTLEGIGYALFEACFVIPDNGLQHHMDAYGIQTFGQPERIGIHSVRRQHL